MSRKRKLKTNVIYFPQVETVVDKWFQNKSAENIVNSFVGNYYDAVKIFRKGFVQILEMSFLYKYISRKDVSIILIELSIISAHR